jgi:hypothetical protein
MSTDMLAPILPARKPWEIGIMEDEISRINTPLTERRTLCVLSHQHQGTYALRQAIAHRPNTFSCHASYARLANHKGMSPGKEQANASKLILRSSTLGQNFIRVCV